jgi:hypothetical protein
MGRAIARRPAGAFHDDVGRAEEALDGALGGQASRVKDGLFPSPFPSPPVTGATRPA